MTPLFSAIRLGVICGSALTLAAAVSAAAPGAADSATPRPAVAILHGTYDHNRHQAEHDNALAGLGWATTKYALTDIDRLLAELDRYDLVIGNPLFNYGPDTRDLGLGGARWRAFLERGGAVVLSDCNYPSCVDWLERLAPSCAVTLAPCATADAARESTPPHPLHRLPNPVSGRNSWQHLVLPAGGWEAMTLCGDGHATTAVQPLGAGLLVLSTPWPLGPANLENLWANLQLRRLGLRATRFEIAPLGLGDGVVTLGLQGVGAGARAVTLRYTLEPAQGQARTVSATAEVGSDAAVELRLACSSTRADDRARARLELQVADRAVRLFEHTLELVPLLDVRLDRPAYRGIVPAAARPGEVVLGVTVTPEQEPLAELTLEAWVCAAAGAELTRRERQPVTTNEFTLRLPLPDLGPGDYVVHTDLRRAGAVIATVERRLSLLPDGPAVVIIDEQMNLRVDGKPFFPLGVYHVEEAELPAIAALGLNTVQGWGGNLERARSFLDRAQANGLKVLLEMGGLVDSKVHTEAIEAHVQAFKNHPALLAWYVRDEPSPGQHAVVREAAELFQRLDRAHPTYLVSCSPGDFAVQAQFADIFAVDPYPLPGGPLAMVAQWADAAWKATRGRRPVWLIPQAFDSTSYERQPPERGANPPTPAQERCMVYLSLVHGAKGIVWYTWDDGPNQGAKYHPALQGAIRGLCGEISALAPLLCSGTQRPFVTADGKVHGLVCVAPTGRRLVLVNLTADAVRAPIYVTEASMEQVFTSITGGPDVQGHERRVTLELEPLGVRVFSF
jgi:hypothetical protein